jgi:protein involved in polysaccharide export with SLBB domain
MVTVQPNRRHMKYRAVVVLTSFVLSALLASGSPGQSSPTRDLQPKFETRAELEARQKTAEAQHRTSEAWLLKTRLELGDFQEGDRIVIVRPNVGANADTVVVREGRIVQLAPIGDFSLQGVLRSELNSRLSEHLAKYFKDPTVRATPLLRLSVFGEVRNPGFLYGPADVLLTDVIMKAGGPTALADWDRVVIKRGSDVIWPEQSVRTALNDGLSLDRLHLRAGDEILVGKRREISWWSVFQIASSAFFVAGAIAAVVRR